MTAPAKASLFPGGTSSPDSPSFTTSVRLLARDATTGMLYTEGTNEPALSLYASLGFQTLRIKRGLTRFSA